MKRLIIKSVLLVLIPVIVVTFMMITKSDAWSVHSHEANAALAYHRLDSLRGQQKVVIIAGSNGSFSINSKILSDSLHLPVVNTSTHAGIGVRMEFEMFKDLLEEGDIVIFCPEYYSDKSTLYGETTLLRILSTHRPDAYSKMTYEHWRSILKHLGDHYLRALRHIGSKPFDGALSKQSLNAYGDISCPREHGEIEAVYQFSGVMDEETAAYYQYIHHFAKERGLKLVYLPPTLMKRNYQNQKAQIDSLCNFMSSHDMPLQAAPERYVFDDSLYFDTPYHMTSRGADLRTLNLLSDAKRVLSMQDDVCK